MTKLTTHVLDVYSGKPGNGIKVDLYYLLNEFCFPKQTLEYWKSFNFLYK